MISRAAEKRTHHLQTLDILNNDPALTLTDDQSAVLERLYRRFHPAQQTASSTILGPALRSSGPTGTRHEEGEEEEEPETREKPKPQPIHTVPAFP